MTIQSLRYIIEIASSRSFSQAARNLFISQSALSASVKDAEQELGIEIFQRSNRGVSLTPAGEDCIKYCKEIVERADYLLNKYKSDTEQHMYFSVSSQHLPFAVRAFDELLSGIVSPGFDLAIREVGTAQMLHDVSTGKSELGVGAFQEDQLKLLKRSLYIDDLQFTEIARLNTYVFLRKQHPLANKDALTIEELKGYPYVTYDEADAPNYYSEESIFFKPFQSCIHVQDRSTKMSLIRSSDAFSIGIDLPNFNKDIHFLNSTSAMIAIPFADQKEQVRVGYLKKNSGEPSTTAKQYIDLLIKHAGLLILPVTE